MNERFSIIAVSAFALAVTACNPATQTDAGADPAPTGSPAVAEASPAAAVSHAAWAGKWVGVEGMYVEIQPAADGNYVLTMQSDLDTLGTYTGKDAEGGIAFERGGEQLLLTPANGDQTGLKYLAGKTDCLMVAPGEGYCRD
ncbi:hypothetical protein [Erythrobacter donghaensis]|uniref:hypothetical protein n=1 Tax=Erythrobacter donghaensis TaxID=267135 RepID=UPI000A378D7D|nr:hypothetical protein [Erythrobacter donghaensis]